MSFLNPKKIISAFVVFGMLVPCICLAKENSSGREVIRSLQGQIYEYVRYTEKELNTKVRKDLHEDYRLNIEPRLKNISQYISRDAIRWVDLDFDGAPELLFWTAGLSDGDMAPKEYLFIVKLEGGEAKILIADKLDPKPSSKRESYYYSHLWIHPNKDKGFNKKLAAVFSYFCLGASGSTFVNYEIWFDMYDQKVNINKFRTGFPIEIGSFGTK